MRLQNKHQIISLIGGTVISLAGLISIITAIDPYTANWMVFFFFYLTFLLALSGSLTLIGWLIRKRGTWGLFEDRFRHSVRQGLIVGLMATIMLILQSYGLLFWWVLIPILTFFILIEIFLRTIIRNHAAH